MGRTCSTHGDERNAYRILVGKPEGKRVTGRSRCTWEINMKVDLREIGWGDIYCIHLARMRISEGSREHGNEPSGSIKHWYILEEVRHWWFLKKHSAP
jgi:hypothetical protein